MCLSLLFLVKVLILVVDIRPKLFLIARPRVEVVVVNLMVRVGAVASSLRTTLVVKVLLFFMWLMTGVTLQRWDRRNRYLGPALWSLQTSVPYLPREVEQDLSSAEVIQWNLNLSVTVWKALPQFLVLAPLVWLLVLGRKFR